MNKHAFKNGNYNNGQPKFGPLCFEVTKPRCYNPKHYPIFDIFMLGLDIRKSRGITCLKIIQFMSANLDLFNSHVTIPTYVCCIIDTALKHILYCVLTFPLYWDYNILKQVTELKEEEWYLTREG